MVIHFYLIALMFLSFSLFGKTTFTADHLWFDFPDSISASRNAWFKHDSITINSSFFTFNSSTQKGVFKGNIQVKHHLSTLQGNEIKLDIANKRIEGFGNIVFIGKNISANSEELLVKNYETLILRKNVNIQQDGGQIQSDELVYNLKTDTVLSNKRVKLIVR